MHAEALQEASRNAHSSSNSSTSNSSSISRHNGDLKSSSRNNGDSKSGSGNYGVLKSSSRKNGELKSSYSGSINSNRNNTSTGTKSSVFNHSLPIPLSTPSSPRFQQSKAPLSEFGRKDARQVSKDASNGNPVSRSSSYSPERRCFRCGSRFHSVANCSRSKGTCAACDGRRGCRVVSSRTKIMKILKDSGKFSKVEAIFDSIIRDGHLPSAESCTYMLVGLCKQQGPQKTESRLRNLVNDGVELNATCYNVVINGYCEKMCINEANKVFQLMKENQCVPMRSTINTLIKGYGLAGKPDIAMALFMSEMVNQDDADMKPDVRSYNILIHAWCINDNLGEAMNLMTMMYDGGVQPNVVTFNTMATAFAGKGMALKAEEMIKKMQALRLRPNEHTCGIVVNGLCEEGDVERAFALVQRMTSRGLPPNIVIFNTLMKGYVKTLQLDGIEQVLKLMRSKGSKPNLQTYSIMMDAWCSTGLLSKAKVELEKMIQEGIKPDVTVYGILVKGYVRARDPAEAESLIGEMHDQNLKPNVVIYTTIISGWCNLGKMDDALRIYNEMIKQKVVPNLRTFQTLVWGFSEAKLPNQAENVLKLMKEQKISPNRKVLEMIADAWKGVGLGEEANRFLQTKDDSDDFIHDKPPPKLSSVEVENLHKHNVLPGTQSSKGTAVSFDHQVERVPVQACLCNNSMRFRAGTWRLRSRVSVFNSCDYVSCSLSMFPVANRSWSFPHSFCCQ